MIKLKDLLTIPKAEDLLVSAKAIEIVKRRSSRLRYRRSDLEHLFSNSNTPCFFSMSELKQEVYRIQGYKAEKK